MVKIGASAPGPQNSKYPDRDVTDWRQANKINCLDRRSVRF